MTDFLEKRFHITERGSTIGREIIGGLVTFMAMAYIIFVNPSILGATGMDYTALTLATCISAAIGTLLTAFMANVPFAQAPGLGINALFTYTLCMKLGYTWQQCLGMTFISGLIFLFITLSPLRNKIIEAIPAQLKRAISVGIGMFIALIGLINAGIVTANDNLLDLGNITAGAPLLALIGLIITAILLAYNVRGAILYGILASTIIGIPMGVTNIAISFNFSNLTLAPTFFKLSFSGLMALGIFPLITSILTLSMCDCFDTVGTLTGCAAGCDMLDENGNMKSKDMSKALTADAIATCTGALLGTSTVTTFVESSTGVAAGARTGLASVVTGFLFLLACLLAPIAGIIPSAATAPALIIVGIFMMKNVIYINWTDMEIAIPAFLTIAMMPFAYSISDGIGFGLISYTLLKVARGKYKEVPILMYILSALFIIMYIVSGV